VYIVKVVLETEKMSRQTPPNERCGYQPAGFFLGTEPSNEDVIPVRNQKWHRLLAQTDILGFVAHSRRPLKTHGVNVLHPYQGDRTFALISAV
jgi:hypothetical protein